MSFTVSPGVSTSEIDDSTVVPNVSTATAAIVGQFEWGAVEEIEYVDTEDQLVAIFGKPSLTNYTDFMCASSYLAYAGGLKVVRVVGTGALNAGTAGTGVLVKNTDHYDTLSNFSSNIFIAKYPGILGNALTVAYVDAVSFDAQDTNGNYLWDYHAQFSAAPVDANSIHIVVLDKTGAITGTAGSMLEKFENVSFTAGTKYYTGESAYINDVLTKKSSWLWVGDASSISSALGGSGVLVNDAPLSAGANGSAISSANYITGWDMFTNSNEVDVSLCIAGGADTTAATYILQDVAEYRKDAVAFVSPMLDDVVGVSDNGTAITAIKATRTSYGSSSYGFMDNCYKLMYDRYNAVDRWVPLNGDMAGLAARASNTNDDWWSPAGYRRGRIKNCIKLSLKLKQSEIDTLSLASVNCVVNKPSTGPLLMNDRTLQSFASAFDHIGVRRLFIYLEKTISQMAEAELFEFNDVITRTQFVNTLKPFLKTVQGRRGLTKFEIICDETNNTEDVISRNQFVASIYVLPNYDINYIELNFIAVNSSAQFTENVVR